MQAITTALAALSVGEPQHLRNLVSFAADEPGANAPEYLKVSEALQCKIA